MCDAAPDCRRRRGHTDGTLFVEAGVGEFDRDKTPDKIYIFCPGCGLTVPTGAGLPRPGLVLKNTQPSAPNVA